MTWFDCAKKYSQRSSLALLALVLFVLFPSGAVFAGEKFVAVIMTGNLECYRQAHAAFMESIDQGIPAEEGMRVYVQTPNPDPISWANSIRKAVGLGADIIITYGASASLAAKSEARNTPILFADVYDPVALHLVRNPLRPGGNLSGISSKTPLDTLVKTFREIHAVRSMGVLFSSSDLGSLLQVKRIEELGHVFGFEVLKRDIGNPQDIPEALAFFAGRIESLFVTESPALHHGLVEVVDFSRQKSLPLLGQIPGLSDRGALISLEADPVEQGELLADYLRQVLGGSKIGKLPVRTPRKVSLVINLGVARSLGYKVPFQALSLATRVIK
jgi:putative ABC transport system substrate-binding protein